MIEMLDANIFYSEVIYKEEELDRPPFVFPQAWGGECFIVSLGF